MGEIDVANDLRQVANLPRLCLIYILVLWLKDVLQECLK